MRSNAKGDIYVPRARIKIFKNSIAVAIAHIWNALLLRVKLTTISKLNCTFHKVYREYFALLLSITIWYYFPIVIAMKLSQ